VKIAGCPPVDSIKEPQRISGLDVKARYWDLHCLECGLPMLRLLRINFLVLPTCPAQSRCKNCESVHIIELLRKGKNTFQILVQRDYRDQSALEESPFFLLDPIQYFQTQWKRRKPSKQVINHVFRESKGKCPGCGCKLTLAGYGTLWHVDHNIPLSRQGTNELKNLLALCGDCNHDKHDCTLREFKAGKRHMRGSELWS
jgi:hypothetical protein